MSDFAWGSNQTQFFFGLTPDQVLDAVEATGLVCTGRCFALNSMENRVYDVELERNEEEAEAEGLRKNDPRNFRIVKFYRPGRWSEEQILAEHEFLRDLASIEIPVVAPLPFPDGSTLKKTPEGDIWYAIFPKVGGRAPEELTDEQIERVGRLLARIHNCGAAKEAPSRIRLTPETYGRANLDFLIQDNQIPMSIRGRYINAVERILELSTPWFEQAAYQRIHGDCHYGNLLWSPDGPFFLDFDDMVQGPPVQDLWLVIPGRDTESKQRFDLLLEAYSQMRDFDRRTLRLIEPLRALRFVHFAAWMAKRWEDPAFPRAFPHFGTERYWMEQLQDMEEQLRLIQETAQGGGGLYSY